MRKTFLKVALIGLLVGSLPVGFTSCKDYDNDIENLDTQVADLKTKLASVESAIAGLPTKADVTAAQAAAVAQAKADLEAVKAELQAAIDGKADKATVDAINTELSSIKGQLETLEALKAEVGSSLEAINGSIDELKADAEAKGQMIAGIQAQIAELTENGSTQFAALTEELNALKTTVNDPTSGIAALKAQIEELAQKINTENPGGATSLEAVVRLMNGMITHIEVVGVDDNKENHRGYDNSLNLYTVTVAEDLVFGQGYATDGSGQLGFDQATFNIANKEVFKKGDVKTFNDSILIRVSPANAVVTADQIQLVNSQLKDLNEFVQVTEVKAYTGLLTNAGSRSLSNNGLHVVKFALKDDFNDVEGFVKATDANNGEGDKALINFAVAIADSEKELVDAGREITSAYSLVVNAKPNKNQYELDYNVVLNKVPTAVEKIRNRFLYANDTNNDNSSLMFPDFEDYETAMDEVYAKRVAQNNYETASENGFTAVGDFAWVENDKEEQVATYASANDDRTEANLLEVKQGDVFTVDMSAYNVDDQKGIYGFYVTLDMWRATESNGSEREAWKSVAPYISGINAVTTGDKINISISKDAKVDAGEILGFRVYAVNYDGTMVDPDGRAFYVVVNKPVEATATASATISAPATSLSATAEVTELGAWTATVPAVNVTFAVNGVEIAGETGKFINNNPTLPNNIYVTLNGGKGETIKASDKKATEITRGTDGKGYDVLKNIAICLPDWKYGDGLTYTGVLTITDASTELVLQTINVEITKTVANNAPTGFGVATQNGFPATGDLEAVITNTTGDYNISTMFNWGQWPANTNLGVNDYTEKVVFQAAVTGTPAYAENSVTANAGILKLGDVTLQKRGNTDPNFNDCVINNGKYPMTVSYSYGNAEGKMFSYVPKTGADGKLVAPETCTINGNEVQYQPYELVPTVFSTSRNISFVTIASKLTFSWMPKKGNVAAYAPSLTYNENGEIDLTKVVASQTITQSTPWKDATIASLIAANKIKNLEVTLSDGLSTYFTPSVSGNKIVFTAKQGTETPMADVPGQVTIKFNDDVTGSGAISLQLPSITMKK